MHSSKGLLTCFVVAAIGHFGRGARTNTDHVVTRCSLILFECDSQVSLSTIQTLHRIHEVLRTHLYTLFHSLMA
ncbi:hypothetical protein BDR07DRAFT_271126 [Suillus spraguei]|nr:hypothetical protein BDR07DRAFT_271126 [Suillus spraguei]